jgi:hypothetical protein
VLIDNSLPMGDPQGSETTDLNTGAYAAVHGGPRWTPTHSRLKNDLDRAGIVSKTRIARNGTRAGGKPFSRGALYALLSNPICIGEIRHKQERYPGQHEAIVDRELWDRVHERLRDQAARRRMG